ncbi:MAG: tripartite tricarboxylate transporter substrate binding protein [Betaproteobacteria bacterium]|nr:tripartite tricarboxylate transporter substrate binding protein [Betaproteobacteria bacterium]
MRKTPGICLALLLGVFLAGCAHAQAWPARPVKIVVSFPPGSTPDTVARVLAPKLQEALGQPFVVENRAGAGGNLAADQVAKSPADGYTLLVSTNAAVATNKVLYRDLPYDPEKDLETISLLAAAPQLLVVHPSVAAHSFTELVAYVRANPGRLSYGSVGSGSAAHLTMELLKSEAKLFIVHIPYRGFPQAVTDMVGGNIHVMFAIAPGVLPQVKAGRLRALAVTSLKRIDSAPEVPSIAELGLPRLESLAWIGLLAPARMPAAIIERLAIEARKGLRAPDAAKLLANQGFEVVANAPAEFRRFQHAEIEKWGKVIRSTGATPE